MEKELHLFIVWEQGRYKENDILSDIKLNFQIVKCYDILWSDECVSDNFTRFYGTNLPKGSGKEKECGTGRFLLVIVYDENPHYEIRRTSKGDAVVNVTMFDAKSKYRAWTGGGHKIHATNSPKETNHDLTLLLGINVADFIENEYNNNIFIIDRIERDLVGAKGWKSISELFYVLNNTVNYVVLRGKNELLNNQFSEEHRDVDLLIDDYENTKYVINGISCCSKTRPHEKVTIDGYDYYLDLWSIQKRYFDPFWCQEMLSNKVLANGYFFLDEKNEFYTLLYHCLIYKNKIADDYRQRINELQKRLSVNETDLHKLLVGFLKDNLYDVYFSPLDASLTVHTENANINEYATRYGYLISRSDVVVDGNKITTKVYRKENSFFKVATKYLIDREYKYLMRLQNESFVPKVLDYGELNAEFNYIEIGKCIGITPIEFFKMSEHQHLPYVKSFVEETLNAILILIKHNILHRDLLPQNILVVEKKGRCYVSIIDFGWSVDIGEKNVITPAPLGTGYYDKNGYSDVYSLGKVINDIEKYHNTRYECRIGNMLKQVTSIDYTDRQVLSIKIQQIQKQLSLKIVDRLSEWRFFIKNHYRREFLFSFFPASVCNLFRNKKE